MATEGPGRNVVDLTGDTFDEFVQAAQAASEEHTPVSAELTRLDTDHLSSFIEHLRHDTDESEETYTADVDRELGQMRKDWESGDLKPNPTDGTFMKQFRALKFNVMSAVSRISGTPGASLSFFRESLLSNFQAALSDIANQLTAHQSAVEDVVEPDVPRSSDDVIAYLHSLNLHVQLDDSQSAPERTQAIHDAFKRAQIDQDPDRIRELLGIVGVVDPDPESTTSDATYFADLLSGKLKRGGPNEQRRNWFMGAGIPVERQPTRASGAVALAAQAGPVRPTSTMNETQILLAPPPKKGAPARDKSSSTEYFQSSGDESPEREKPTELEMLADIDKQIAIAEERGDTDSAKALKELKENKEAALESEGKDREGILAKIEATKKSIAEKRRKSRSRSAELAEAQATLVEGQTELVKQQLAKTKAEEERRKQKDIEYVAANRRRKAAKIAEAERDLKEKHHSPFEFRGKENGRR